jgi:hypothetical protein
MANNPRLYSNNVRLGHATVADSIDKSFHPAFLPGTSQYSPSPNYPPMDVPQTFANSIYPPMQIMSHQNYGTGLSQEKILKIQELKLMMNKYPQYHTNPDDIIRFAVFNSISGDDTLLDGKLVQLRSLDRRLNGGASRFTVF